MKSGQVTGAGAQRLWSAVRRFFGRQAPTHSKFDESQAQPLFMAISNDDPAMLEAYAAAAASMGEFKRHVERGGEHYCCAKLKFRDPDQSARLGEDRFVYLWLSNVVFHAEQGLFSGAFFEVPPELQKWHTVGQRLGFEADDVFDWMVNDDGRLFGGFTLRVARSKLPESQRASYDRYTGVTSYEPLTLTSQQ